MTDYDYGCDELYIHINHDVLYLKVILFDEARITKTLNTLKNKDFHIEEMSEVDALKLSHCIGFTKDPFAKQVVEDSVKIFCSAENIDYELQINLFSFLIAAIKFHFSNDVKKIKELITMALSSLEIDSFDKLSSFEKKDYMINLLSNYNEELIEENSLKDREISDLKEKLRRYEK